MVQNKHPVSVFIALALGGARTGPILNGAGSGAGTATSDEEGRYGKGIEQHRECNWDVDSDESEPV